MSQLVKQPTEYSYGLKVRIFPSSYQKLQIKRSSDASRFIYNELVAINKELYLLRQVKTYVSVVVQRIQQLEARSKSFVKIADFHPWLNDSLIDSLAKSNAIRAYQAAWKRFRDVPGTGTPNFHKKSYEEKYQTSNQGSHDLFSGSIRFLDEKHVQLPKLGRIRIKNSQKFIFENGQDIKIGMTSVSKDSLGHYFASFSLTSSKPFKTALKANNNPVGVDLNTENFLTTSNGDVIDNPRYYRKSLKKLKKAQRILSRRARRAKTANKSLRIAKNYQKQRLVVAQLHKQVFNKRQNFLHNVSTTLIKNHDQVIAEELRSKNMMRNHRLAMSIQDVGWRGFLTMLDYKAKLYNRVAKMINPRNTTQTCSTCGHLLTGNHKLTLKDREWTCPQCHSHHVRDVNAAKNILAKGLTA